MSVFRSTIKITTASKKKRLGESVFEPAVALLHVAVAQTDTQLRHLTYIFIGLYCNQSKHYPYLRVMVVKPLLSSGRSGF